MMVEDHTKANDKLASLAQAADIPLPRVSSTSEERTSGPGRQ